MRTSRRERPGSESRTCPIPWCPSWCRPFRLNIAVGLDRLSRGEQWVRSAADLIQPGRTALQRPQHLLVELLHAPLQALEPLPHAVDARLYDFAQDRHVLLHFYAVHYEAKASKVRRVMAVKAMSGVEPGHLRASGAPARAPGFPARLTSFDGRTALDSASTKGFRCLPPRPAQRHSPAPTSCKALTSASDPKGLKGEVPATSARDPWPPQTDPRSASSPDLPRAARRSDAGAP